MKHIKAVQARIRGDQNEQSKRDFAREMAAMERLVGESGGVETGLSRDCKAGMVVGAIGSVVLILVWVIGGGL